MPITAPEIAVAAGVIAGPGDQVLLTRRLQSAHQGGKWEFPGGKIEADEAPAAALRRELNEELGINVVTARSLIEVAHDYGDKRVRLYVFVVDAFTGQPGGLEGQAMQWFDAADLTSLEFPDANRPIVAAYLSSLDSAPSI
ncbi:8-oxo-dGTP diphosphatase MutT [Litorivicinus lipolyticus]|jgi:8-oxo-dGTP diphosphatase|uniref:8-oxo-dGTP diphosphatase n=1 Tax=Litorivicinus lipolyticus TaxID=418701 RepID=A0A5Q2QCT0_9GAMM|nr:8-oxo-dGTP diphosphatase MutT [Litorivicinus lipolyticus]QGG80934.1 8-oxo-dGTP diphosphatase MutT [Litorivicinus lipolyticus]